MQQVLFSETVNASTSAKDRAACARAWDVLEDRKREIRGKPKTGAYRPTGKPIKSPAYLLVDSDPSA